MLRAFGIAVVLLMVTGCAHTPLDSYRVATRLEVRALDDLGPVLRAALAEMEPTRERQSLVVGARTTRATTRTISKSIHRRVVWYDTIATDTSTELPPGHLFIREIIVAADTASITAQVGPVYSDPMESGTGYTLSLVKENGAWRVAVVTLSVF